jgi:hypothetical protein
MDLSIKSLSQKWQLYPFTYQGSNFTLLGNFTTYCFSANPKNVDTTDAEMPKKFSRLVIQRTYCFSPNQCSLVHHVNSSIKFETAHWAVTFLVHKLPTDRSQQQTNICKHNKI